MDKKHILDIEKHKLWIDSLGKKGEKIVLEEKIVEGGVWRNISLSQGSIIDCRFHKIVMENWDFYAAMLCSSCFEETKITSGKFVKADLVYTQFLNTKIESANFSKTDLSNSTFENVEITNSKFINSLIHNVCFSNAILINIDFTGAYIENLLLEKDTVLKDIHGWDADHIISINIGTVKNQFI